MADILITGGQGFVGSIIKRQLDGCILTPTIDQLDLQNSDSVRDFFNSHSIDTVIHCALTGREDLFSTDPKYTTDSLWMFRNLYRHRHQFGQLINLGTAYEFDLQQNNWLVSEDDMLDHLPQTSYGLAKNLISRVIKDTDNFYNLKLFGVFHQEEQPQRFFKKLFTEGRITVNQDCYMDYIYLEDLVPMIKTIISGTAVHREINMVYAEKLRLSEMALEFAEIHNIPRQNIKINALGTNNLTGRSDRLAHYGFDLQGLTKGFHRYKL